MILTWKTTIKMMLTRFIFSTIGLIQNTQMQCSILFVNIYSTNCLWSNCKYCSSFGNDSDPPLQSHNYMNTESVILLLKFQLQYTVILPSNSATSMARNGYFCLLSNIITVAKYSMLPLKYNGVFCDDQLWQYRMKSRFKDWQWIRREFLLW